MDNNCVCHLTNVASPSFPAPKDQSAVDSILSLLAYQLYLIPELMNEEMTGGIRKTISSSTDTVRLT